MIIVGIPPPITQILVVRRALVSQDKEFQGAALCFLQADQDRHLDIGLVCSLRNLVGHCEVGLNGPLARISRGSPSVLNAGSESHDSAFVKA